MGWSTRLREPLFLVLAAFAAFGAAVTSSFHFDDYGIFSDPVATSPSGWWQVWGPLRTRPLTYLSFWLNYQAGAREPFGYHALNLALHIGVVLLLWELLRRIVPPRAALIAALLFAIHPIQSEPVAYVFARAVLIAALFSLLSALAWIQGRPWLAVCFFALALLGKEEAAAFPLALCLLDKARARQFKAPLVAMLALSLAAGLHVMWVAKALGESVGSGAGVSPWAYLSQQGSVIVRYLRLVAVPWGFTVDPEIHPAWTDWVAWPLLAALLLISWRAKWWPFVIAIVLLLPSSSIFPAADLAADRRMYLPMLAVAAGGGLLLNRLRWPWIAAIGVALIFLSAGRMRVWQTEQSLWEEAVHASPGAVRPKVQLARAVGGYRALDLLRQAQELAPEAPEVASEMGRIHLQAGDPDKALQEFGRALALAPRDPRALNNRGAALLALGQKDAAMADFQRALEIDPCLFEARLNLRNGPGPKCRYTPEQERSLTMAAVQ